MKGLFEPTDTAKKTYWLACEKHKEPFLLIRSKGEKYIEIFFDITHLKLNIDNLSDDLKQIYMSYVNFFMLPYLDISDYIDQQYFFRFLIIKEHKDVISEQLFDYLLKYGKTHKHS